MEDEAFVHMLTDEEVAQVIGYLAATKQRVGLLFNPSAVLRQAQDDSSGQALGGGDSNTNAFCRPKR